MDSAAGAPARAGAFDVGAYLERIGLSVERSGRSVERSGLSVERSGLSGGSVGLAELHRAHVCAIPFENLDPHRGVPVSLEPEALARKLIGARRGGYCFEQNLLLAAALRELGADVQPMLGRVRLGRGPGVPRPRSHLVLRVAWEGGVWLADAGFGNGTLLEPIPFEPDPDVVHEQSGWRYRLVPEGAEHVLEAASPAGGASPPHASSRPSGDSDPGGAGWEQLYGFVPEPVPSIDIETSNWFTSTHPRSAFVTGLHVCAHRPDGSFVTLSGWPEPSLSERAPGSGSEQPVALTAVPALLAERFGLPGFRLDEQRRRLV